MKYTVEIHVLATGTASYVVEAVSLRDAERMAREMARYDYENHRVDAPRVCELVVERCMPLDPKV